MAIMIPNRPHAFAPASLEGVMFTSLEKLPDEFVTDICPNQVKFYFENETLSFDTYFYHGVEQFVEMVKLMMPATEETPYCLPDEEPDDED